MCSGTLLTTWRKTKKRKSTRFSRGHSVVSGGLCSPPSLLSVTSCGRGWSTGQSSVAGRVKRFVVYRRSQETCSLGPCACTCLLAVFIRSCVDQHLISLMHFRCLQWPLLTLRGPVSANPITGVPTETTHKPHLPTADCLLPNAVTVTAYRWR